jgi:hypothetical protein
LKYSHNADIDINRSAYQTEVHRQSQKLIEERSKSPRVASIGPRKRQKLNQLEFQSTYENKFNINTEKRDTSEDINPTIGSREPIAGLRGLTETNSDVSLKNSIVRFQHNSHNGNSRLSTSEKDCNKDGQASGVKYSSQGQQAQNIQYNFFAKTANKSNILGKPQNYNGRIIPAREIKYLQNQFNESEITGVSLQVPSRTTPTRIHHSSNQFPRKTVGSRILEKRMSNMDDHQRFLEMQLEGIDTKTQKYHKIRKDTSKEIFLKGLT